VLAGLDSNQRRSGVQGAVAPAVRATGHREPPARCRPRLIRPYKGRRAPAGGSCRRPPGDRRVVIHHSFAGTPRKRRVRPPGLEPGRPLAEHGHLKAARLPVSATSAWSRHPVPTRIIRHTKAEPQAVRGGVATLPGLEPGTSATRARRFCRVELEGTE